MTAKHKIGEVASTLGISATTIYKKIGKLKDKLDGHIIKDSGSLVFDEIAVEILRAEIPAAKKDTTMVLPQKDLALEMSDLKKAIMLLVEENRQMKTALSVLVDDNRIMRSEVSNLQKCLEYKKTGLTHHTEVSENLMTTGKEIPPRRSAPPIVNPTQKEVTFCEGFNQNLKEVQAWLQGVFAPFTEVFKSS